jgi:hypothetical protein
MERLTSEGEHADATDAQLAALLRIYRDGAPGQVPPSRKQRLLRDILAGRRSPVARRALLLRPAVALAVLLLAGATLAATAGHDFLARGLRRLTTSAAEPPSVPEAKRVREATPPPAVVRQEQEEQDEPPAAVVPPPLPVEARVTLPAPARGHATARATEHLRIAKGEDPSKVVAAIRALRSEHDPARARALLSAYLQQYPNGALSEEALALSIEAATTLHDGSATAFATRYLHAYPRGRFRRAAEQALRLP